MIVKKEYTEGRITFVSADVDYYTENKKQPTADMPVFMNPRMRLNRDFSVLFLAAYLEGNPIELMCEPLAGCGVRTLRYLKECHGEFSALMFDANPNAVETINKNIENLGLSERARAKHGDAKVLLLTESRGKRFDYVDVDPFGTPVPYLNAAIQSMSPKGGLLAITATDMAALYGVYPRVALRKYGGLSTRTPFSHELAVRLVIGHTFSVAGANDYSITPLAVLSTDHYVRIWLTVKAARDEANRQVDDMGLVRYCPDCMHVEVIPLRSRREYGMITHQKEGCTGRLSTAGPLWIGRLYDTSILGAAERIIPGMEDVFEKRVKRMLKMMVGESALDTHPFIDIHALCDLHNLVPPKLTEIISAIRESGHLAERTHFRPTALRTNAEVGKVTEIVANLSGGK
ncbi:MAG: RsmD family RNA methyltransferase [Candidatus Thorarchaeota archaeon]|jgi:tRNA (guanine26-N2/guanine27-N2)-dimethyltransferase